MHQLWLDYTPIGELK